MSRTQEHDKFKFFQAPCSSVADLKKLFKKVEKWVADNDVAPKSIGILWSKTGIFSSTYQEAIMSLGFRDTGIPYEITLTLADAGNLIQTYLEAGAVVSLDDTIIAKKNPGKVLCHELLLFNDEVFVIFMSKKQS
jgi:hypothetical protein